LFACCAVALFPFRWLGRLAAFPIRGRTHRDLQAIYRIRWALQNCAPRVPWRALCFEQGLAAQLMLRRRGIPSVLHYGAAMDDQRGLTAHVWVGVGDIDVVGGEFASQFSELVRFPKCDG
jgi:hypothetical protein